MNSTEDDYEIRRTIWESRIPVEFNLDSSQPILRAQQSTFIMLPRISYFPFYLEEILHTLTGNALTEIDLSNVWLLNNGEEMIRWHYPIGVLYDMYRGKDQNLPWVVTVRLKDFPDELVRCLSKDSLKFMFIQSLKEASQIKHKRNIVSTMTKEEHVRLFDSIKNDKFDEFWSINKKLMGSKSDPLDVQMANVPFRFYFPSFPFRQTCFPLIKKDDLTNNSSSSTLIEVLEKAFPEHCPFDDQKFEVISHGIDLPLDSSVGWIARNMSYPDNFVHIVVKPKRLS
uniref:Autophagy protein 5 n=2 Tax=Meloidogyne TaxID=189290 RepID=A0A914KZZ4_MELIC